MLSPSSTNGTNLLKVNISTDDMEDAYQPVFTDTKKISIIIPAYNEENRIGQTIKDLEANIPFIAEILVIFDGSDHTPEVAMRSGIKVIQIAGLILIHFLMRKGIGIVPAGGVFIYQCMDPVSVWIQL